MNALFQKLAPEKRKSFRVAIRLSRKEYEEIQVNANIRNLTVSEFIRRAALGRRADVRIETQIVTQLIHLVQEIRSLRKSLAEVGACPPDEKIIDLIRQASAVMLQIKNYCQ